tara:strand:+ start:532 stop:789 length:258 start_codon:yes stop_codon:yes gene_type:complete
MRVVIGLLLVVLVFLVSCSPTFGSECINDKGCVPDACCHATGAVPLGQAPNCEGVLCSMECAPGTLDCGQGEVKCIENKCVAVIN